LDNHHTQESQNPPDLTFTLRLGTNRTAFHQGEVIPIEILISSATINKYVFSNRSYDRSGRLGIDGFVLDKPNQVTDPLADYFSKGFEFFLGGGLFSEPSLSSKPEIIKYNLNEWLRFNKIGKYRLYVSSPRVSVGKPFNYQEREQITVTSNIVEFEVLPVDEELNKKLLDKAVNRISAGANAQDTKEACLTLRYLDTEDAAKVMIGFLAAEKKTCEFDFYKGLQGSSKREFVIQEMQRIMEKPETIISGGFLQTLSLLSYFNQSSDWPKPYPLGNEQAIKEWSEERKKQKSLKEAQFKKYSDSLAKSLNNRKGKALAVGLDTSLIYGTSELNDGLLGSLIESFSDLPEERQESLLEHSWEKIKTPKLLPALRTLLTYWNNKPQVDYHYSIRDIALKRLSELSQNEGRKLILAEIERSVWRVSNEVLTILPDKELPEFEDAWIEKATGYSNDFREKETALLLLEKYGTTKSLPILRQFFENKMGQVECPVQANAINYFLKNDPKFGRSMISDAMSARTKTKCHNSVFNGIRVRYWSKDIENIIVNYLNDPNIGVVKEAVEVLGKYGSENVKPMIWQRFEKFSQKIKSDPLAKAKTFGDYSYPLQTIEQAFVNALRQSPNWKLSDEEIEKLSQFCITNACSEESQSVRILSPNPN
jgi:hypothetical protein